MSLAVTPVFPRVICPFDAATVDTVLPLPSAMVVYVDESMATIAVE